MTHPEQNDLVHPVVSFSTLIVTTDCAFVTTGKSRGQKVRKEWIDGFRFRLQVF